MVIVRAKNQNNGNFDEFEVIGRNIPNIFELLIFFEVIIYFNQTRKAKVKGIEKSSSSIESFPYSNKHLVDMSNIEVY